MTEAKSHFSFFSHLRFVAQTVLGLNRRNSHYIFSLNPLELLPLVDEKHITKQRLAALNIPSPTTYGVLRARHELRHLPALCAGHADFVIKPSRGHGGGGIVICMQTTPGTFQVSGNRTWTFTELTNHVDEILSGVFALDERSDTALIEERIHLAPILEPLTFEGIPDLRILVVQGVPLLAMLRLPTKRSGGRANLHVGGIGLGVDLATGITRRGIYRNFLIKRHPDTKALLSDFHIPHWHELLCIAAHCADAVPLGYLGVDLVLDARHGPQVLELNARPGLQIQLANGVGLRPLLDTRKKFPAHIASIDDRVAAGIGIYAEVLARYEE